MAIPVDPKQYACILSTQEGLSDQAPLWSGIRIRPDGNLFDSMTNTSVNILNGAPTTYLWESSSNRRENCVYFHGYKYVETRCTFLHTGTDAIRCACYQGNYWRLLRIVCSLKPRPKKFLNCFFSLVVFSIGARAWVLAQLYIAWQHSTLF